jgi:hypothetical protein
VAGWAVAGALAGDATDAAGALPTAGVGGGMGATGCGSAIGGSDGMQHASAADVLPSAG